ncbi:MAG: VOC family protein [Gammaproteobacteria bacterium]|nr:VOC family protein [Gammaproteobacteria bacterium]
MAQSVTPFLMFKGNAEEAIELYASLFNDSDITDVVPFGQEQPELEGQMMMATLTLAGQQFKCLNSHIPHEFDFTPSYSIFVECESEDELIKIYETLSTDGEILMPLDHYGFSKKYVWLNDRYGVSWQLNLR